MTTWGKTLTIRSSPHVAATVGVDSIMLNVVLALLPISIFAVYAFGMAGLLVLVTAVVTCVVTEHALCRARRLPTTIGDWSAVVTGLLYGLVLPPGLPLWMVVVGGIIAIGAGKIVFGGLGSNPFNPALVGRAILQAAFPVAMTSWPLFGEARFIRLPPSTLALPLTQPTYDGISAPTPLADWKFNRETTDISELALGLTAGSSGETCALLILAGGAYLIARRMMDWRIPASILATVAVLSAVLHGIDPSRYASPSFMLFSGGLMLGAVFMATDMVASPITHLGSAIYGLLIGTLVIVIRSWGGLPEGVMYAILLGNAVSPHIDNWIRPRVFGARRGQ
jgi:electron transport complex protein RnfD